MRLYNTLTQRVETLRPLGDAVTLYVCGITPYDTTHLGHAFINVVYDTLVRTLRWQGQAVRYVQNVTDIDDDILRKARETGQDWYELGRRETARYLADLRALDVEMPTYYVRATEEIAGMRDLIAALLARGNAYERDGWVYYSVQRDPDFGQLAEAGGYHGYAEWLRVANERGNVGDDPRKQDPLDFVLWQAQQPGEPGWPSPWSTGRPGWHIECSSMATRYLGPRIDLHGGGSDLIFPHHTCEIAQSEHATGQHPFVSIWMHCAMVYKDGQKMSKSLGNLVLVDDLLRRFSPVAVRALLLAHHHRTDWEYADADMRRAADLVGTLLSAAAPAAHMHHLAADALAADEETSAVRARFAAALDDDLDTPHALDILAQCAALTLAHSSQARVGTLLELADVLGLQLRPA